MVVGDWSGVLLGDWSGVLLGACVAVWLGVRVGVRVNVRLGASVGVRLGVDVGGAGVEVGTGGLVFVGAGLVAVFVGATTYGGWYVGGLVAVGALYPTEMGVAVGWMTTWVAVAGSAVGASASARTCVGVGQ